MDSEANKSQSQHVLHDLEHRGRHRTSGHHRKLHIEPRRQPRPRPAHGSERVRCPCNLWRQWHSDAVTTVTTMTTVIGIGLSWINRIGVWYWVNQHWRCVWINETFKFICRREHIKRNKRYAIRSVENCWSVRSVHYFAEVPFIDFTLFPFIPFICSIRSIHLFHYRDSISHWHFGTLIERALCNMAATRLLLWVTFSCRSCRSCRYLLDHATNKAAILYCDYLLLGLVAWSQ